SDLLTMTDGALAGVHTLRSILLCLGRSALGQLTRPRDVIGVQIEDVGLGIEGLAAPLRATIQSREDYGFTGRGEGNELTFASERAETIERPLMCLGRARCQHVFGHQLARVGSRLRGKA